MDGIRYSACHGEGHCLSLHFFSFNDKDGTVISVFSSSSLSFQLGRKAFIMNEGPACGSRRLTGFRQTGERWAYGPAASTGT